MNNRVLFVDDDIDILLGFQRTLRKHFIIKTATSGAEALQLIRENPPFSVIVSDYNMPSMSGVELLSRVKKASSDTVRILLTGFANVDIAINAVNEGNIFRLLTKPVNNELLIQSINNGIELYQLIVSEREILNKTLKGLIKMLVDILSASSPFAFNQAAKLRNIARDLAAHMQISNSWEVEIAALLSRIGLVTLPQSIIDKVSSGLELTFDEKKLFDNYHIISEQLLKNIPRLEKIARSIKYQNINYDGSNNSDENLKIDELPIVSHILKVANDYLNLIDKRHSPEEAISVMRENAYIYAPAVLTALLEINNFSKKGYVIRSLSFKQLRIGMVLAEDLKDIEQFMLLPKGQEITDIVLMRLINLAKIKQFIEPIRVIDIQQVDYDY